MEPDWIITRLDSKPPNLAVVHGLQNHNYCQADATATPEGEANARLIAAAPTMLAALESIVAWAETTEATSLSLHEARTAIAKAMGKEKKESPE